MNNNKELANILNKQIQKISYELATLKELVKIIRDDK